MENVAVVPEFIEHVHVQNSLTDGFTIPVTLEEEEGSFGLSVPPQYQYVSVVENYDNTITWTLDPNGFDAMFDNPPVVFLNSPGPLHITRGNLEAKVEWSNVDMATRGQSFSYRLRVLVRINGMLIPISHDPTVHNDPPTE